MLLKTNKYLKQLNIIHLVILLILIFLLVIIFNFFFYSKYLDLQSETMKKIENESKKMQLNSEMMELARARTRLTSKIIDLDDPFEQDELNLQLETYAGQFAKLRSEFLTLNLTEEEKQLLQNQQQIIPIILPNQRKAVALAMNETPEGRKQAETLLYEIVLPGQAKMIDILGHLIAIEKEIISSLSATSQESLNKLQRQSGIIISITFMVVIFISLIVILRIKSIQSKLLNHQKNLEKIVDTRTKDLRISNIALEESLKEVKSAQSKLIESEKMAALGGLVSGVAHEINTPLGVSITANSHLKTENEQVSQLLKNNELKKSKLTAFIDLVGQSVNIIEINLSRSAELIKNFKKVAVDQSVEDIREIDLSAYAGEILSSLKPKWKHSQVKVETALQENLRITTYPGAIAQLLTNLITNALQHAFDDGKITGTILIEGNRHDSKIFLTFSDDGKGMSQEVMNRIFDPFFTTKRGSGGTGLGMHIVYNLVTQKLHGNISVESTLTKGTQFIIELPEAI